MGEVEKKGRKTDLKVERAGDETGGGVGGGGIGWGGVETRGEGGGGWCVRKTKKRGVRK